MVTISCGDWNPTLGQGIPSHLPVLRGVSIAKGAGDHQDQGFVLQVHNVILLHGHCLGVGGAGEERRGECERGEGAEGTRSKRVSYAELPPGAGPVF